MKRCPSCQQTYADDALSFCLNDGSRLVPVEPQSSDSVPTLVGVFPPPVNQTTPQQTPRETMQGNWNAPTPSWADLGYQQPTPAPKKRSALPWVLGIMAVLLIGAVAVIAIVAVSRSSNENSNKTNTNNSNSVVNGNANRSPNSNSNNSNNSNANNSNSNENSNSNSNSNAAPTDTDEVLADLLAIEDDWNEANVKADKDTLDYVLASDYKGASGDKKKYIAEIQPNPDIASQTVSDTDLTLNGNKASLRGINTVKFKKATTQRYRFTDTFVWRDGRWQATGSVSSLIK